MLGLRLLLKQELEGNQGFPGGSDSRESASNARDLGWEDSWEEGMATHSNILAWRIHVDRGAWWAIVCGATESQTRLS